MFSWLVSHKKIKYKCFAAFLLALTMLLHFSISCFALNLDKEDEIKGKIQKILSTQEFAKPEKQTSILKSIADWIKQGVEKYLKDIKLPDTNLNLQGNLLSPGAAFALKAAGIIILLAFIFVLLYFIFRNLRRSRGVKQEEDALLLSTLKDPELVEQKALEFYKLGDYKQGIRYLYIALILKFNELNIVKIDKSKTNRQYMNEVRSSGFSKYDLAFEFTHAFNEYWYGNRAIDKEKFEVWHEKYTILIKGGVS